MVPTHEQIEVAAFHLWARRGRRHGRDCDDWYAARKQLAFDLNYETIVEYPLFETHPRVIGEGPIRNCRFCERNSKRVRFGPPRRVVPFLPTSSLVSVQVCDECQVECCDPLAGAATRLWESLQTGPLDGNCCGHSPSNRACSLGAYKALVASALLVAPSRELEYFFDALEWVNNPDPHVDEPLFASAACRAYHASGPSTRPSVSLSRRIDDRAPLPYLSYFVQCERVILQIHLPLCSRDENLDAQTVEPPERLFTAGDGGSFHVATSRVLAVGADGNDQTG
jgi:hypothetical protein